MPAGFLVFLAGVDAGVAFLAGAALAAAFFAGADLAGVLAATAFFAGAFWVAMLGSLVVPVFDEAMAILRESLLAARA